MKKILYFMFLAVLSASFVACSSDDNDDGGSGNLEITATVKCKLQNGELADYRAPLMLFTYFSDYNQYEYDYTKYIFVHKTTGEKKNPTKKATADQNGFVKITDNQAASNCIVVLQSSQFPKQYKIFTYDELKLGQKLELGSFVFTE